jgi:hypothetical protein
MLIVSTLAGLVVLLPAARWCARRELAATSSDAGAGALASAPVEVVAGERKP